MRRAEGVIFALRALRKAVETSGLADGPDSVAPARQDLVGIGLVADVPNEAVLGRVEDVVQRDRELDDAQPGTEMSPGVGHGVDRLLPEFARELFQLVERHIAHVQRELYAIQ